MYGELGTLGSDEDDTTCYNCPCLLLGLQPCRAVKQVSACVKTAKSKISKADLPFKIRFDVCTNLAQILRRLDEHTTSESVRLRDSLQGS